MVVTTLLFREIKKQYPNIKIIVICGENNKEILKYNKNVDQILNISKKSFLKNLLIFKKLRKLNINLGIDFYLDNLRFNHLLMLRIISVNFLIGFYKDLYNVYNLSINKDFSNVHVSEMYKYLLEILKIENPNLQYDVVLGNNEEHQAIELIKKCNSKYKILLNPFAASKHRSFGFNKLNELIELLETKIDTCLFVVCQEKNKKKLDSLKEMKTFIVSFTSIIECAALIKYVDVVISPDTSIVHIAANFCKKTVALYLNYSNPYEKIDIIWGPNNPNAIQLSVSAEIENDIKNIPNIDILNALKRLL
jgi:ADP-heptose:LPS heptosyltransferase